MIEESRYNQLVAAAFKRVLSALDQLDPDILEADSTADMLTISSATGGKCIVNTQRAVRQIWVAGKGQGIHFNYDEKRGAWLDDKGKGLELLAFVADVATDLGGIPIKF